jgi:beta-phosphoglucomutase-like phosphatase (HAD superfamily)
MTTKAKIRSVEALREYLTLTGPFEVAVWDFDGVVGDTEPVQARVYREMLSERGIAVDDGFFRGLAGRSEYEIWGRLKERYGVEDELRDLREERIGRVAPLLAEIVRPNWFVRPGAAALHEAGARLLIVSSGNKEVVDLYLAAWGLRDLFDEISATTGAAGDLPKRERLRQAIASAKGALVVEDSIEYLRLAAELGAVTLGVKHTLNGEVAEVANAVLGNGLERDR